MALPMDPPDVEMEMDPAPQPPAPAVAPAPASVGEGWSMLSRARGLLEEGKPSLALQLVRTLPPLPFSVRSPFHVLSSRVRLHRRPASGDEMGNPWGFFSRHVSYVLEADQSRG